ncbi:MAG: hypothetical protein ACRDEA_11685 [Microcystaceae cyanobacterium]
MPLTYLFKPDNRAAESATASPHALPKLLADEKQGTAEETPFVRSLRKILGLSQISANKKGERVKFDLLSNQKHFSQYYDVTNLRQPNH